MRSPCFFAQDIPSSKRHYNFFPINYGVRMCVCVKACVCVFSVGVHIYVHCLDMSYANNYSFILFIRYAYTDVCVCVFAHVFSVGVYYFLYPDMPSSTPSPIFCLHGGFGVFFLFFVRFGMPSTILIFLF